MVDYVTEGITMAMTNAAKQAAFRQRRDARIREMGEALRNPGDGAEPARLRAELASTEQTLGWAQDAIKMLKAQNKRLRNGVDEEEPRAGIDEAKLDRAHPEHRENYDKATPGVKTWLNSFANLPRKDAKDAYQLFLCLTAINALPIGKPKKPKAAPAPAKAEEPQPVGAALIWVDEEGGQAAEAVTPAGSYFFWNPGSGLATFFAPAEAPKGDSSYSRGLGNFKTPDEAKAACEQHARSYVRPAKRPSLRAMRNYASGRANAVT